MLRAKRQDVDFDAGIITIREKKRVRGKVTTWRVPMRSRLKEAFAALPSINGSLFGKLSVQAAQKALMRVVSKHSSGAKNGETKVRTEAKRRTSFYSGFGSPACQLLRRASYITLQGRPS
jgi:hypothetical protein